MNRKRGVTLRKLLITFTLFPTLGYWGLVVALEQGHR